MLKLSTFTNMFIKTKILEKIQLKEIPYKYVHLPLNDIISTNEVFSSI